MESPVDRAIPAGRLTGPLSRGPLPRFILFYAVLYAGFGVASPFLPAFMRSHGLSPAALGVALAANTAARLLSGPVSGRIADRFAVRRALMILFLGAAAVIPFAFLPAYGLAAVMIVSAAQAAMLAPIAPLADALALASAVTARFAYGWVRGAGSAAFVLGTLGAGYAVSSVGLVSILWLQTTLLGAAALAALYVPDILKADRPERDEKRGFLVLLRIPMFRRAMVAAAMIQGSHAMHDGFAVISWTSAGISSTAAGFLWSESVMAEVVVFLLVGRPLMNRLSPAVACAFSAVAGVIRWSVLAASPSFWAGAAVEPLHGMTFALQHLVTMRIIADAVPRRRSATAQAFYNTIAVGAAYALLSLVSGQLYGYFGRGAFWAMAAICAAALPAAARLR